MTSRATISRLLPTPLTLCLTRSARPARNSIIEFAPPRGRQMLRLGVAKGQWGQPGICSHQSEHITLDRTDKAVMAQLAFNRFSGIPHSPEHGLYMQYICNLSCLMHCSSEAATRKLEYWTREVLLECDISYMPLRQTSRPPQCFELLSKAVECQFCSMAIQIF